MIRNRPGRMIRAIVSDIPDQNAAANTIVAVGTGSLGYEGRPTYAAPDRAIARENRRLRGQRWWLLAKALALEPRGR